MTLDELKAAVALHETFWAAVAQAQTSTEGRKVMRWWLDGNWGRFFSEFWDRIGRGFAGIGEVEHFVDYYLARLNELRAIATKHGIQLPAVAGVKNMTVGAIVGDEVDESMERLHENVMAFGQALRDAVFVPGTWTLRPGAEQTDRYHFYYVTWAPFLTDWLRFRSEKRDIRWQTLPGSGTAKALRAYRTRFSQVLTQAERDGLVSGTGYTPPAWAVR